MDESIEIKTPEPPKYEIHFGMTKKEIAEVVKKMKQDNDMNLKH